MKKALDSYCGVKGCRVSVASIDTSEQEITQHKWSGIQSFNNLEIQRLGSKVWKAYGIGKGKLTRKQELKKMSKPQTKTGLTVHKQFNNPAVNTGALRKTKERVLTCKEATKEKESDNDDRQLRRGFACPELGFVESVRLN